MMQRMTDNDAEQLITRAQAADMLAISVTTLDAWRERGKGPTFIKFSRRAVRYRPADIRKFIAEREVMCDDAQR